MVGDSGSKPPLESIEPVLEGIVRKLSAADCACCFLHAYRGDLTPDDLQPLLDKYEKVADHYGIPSIQIGLAIANGEASGAWSIDELFLDRLHTTPKGAQVMANLTTLAMHQILALRQPSHKTVLHPRLHADDLEGARLLLPDANMTMLPDAFQTGRFRLVLSLIDLQSGNGLCIEAAPSDIWGLLIVAGPRSGVILIETNGTRQEYLTWDKWCDRELLRSVTLAEPVRRGAEFRLFVTDRGGLETSHPKLLRVVGLMLADDSRGAAPACQNRGDA
jgi:hypothetical protein